MKRIYAFLLAAGAVAGAQAEPFYYYDSASQCGFMMDSETFTAKCTRSEYPAANLVVPAEVVYQSTDSSNGTYRVTAVAEEGFMATDIVSVTLPESIVTIEAGAFMMCDQLKTVNLSVGLKEIAGSAFAGCAGLHSIVLPYGVETLGKNAFNETGIGNIVIPETMTSIAPAALSVFDTVTFDVRNLSSWITTEIPGYLEALGSTESTPVYPEIKVSHNGTEIKNLLIPMGVNKVKPYAFWNVKGLESITFPDSMKEIGESAFLGTSISSLKLSSGITGIGRQAFLGCENLAEILLNEGLATIGDEAFTGNESLVSVAVPSTVASLGAGTFAGCIDLEKVVLPEGLTALGDRLFDDCEHLAEVNFPASLRTVGNEAFSNVVRLSEVKLPAGVTSIGDFAFANQGKSTRNKGKFEITLPEGLRSIGASAFAGRNIRSVTLPSTLEEIGEFAFSGTLITDIEIPASMTEIGASAFADCQNLSRAVLPPTLVNIGEKAFSSTSLNGIDLPASLKTIGDEAFNDTKLSGLTVPDNVTALGENILKGTPVSFISLGSGIKTLDKVLGLPDNCVIKLAAATPPTLSTGRLGCTPSLVLVPRGSEAVYKASTRWKEYRIAGENSARVDVYVNEPGTLASEIRIQTGKMPAEVTNLNVEGTLSDADFATIRSNMTSCYDVNLSKITNTIIPQDAFKGKANLIQMTLPSGIEKIFDDAFNGCAVMHLSTLPATLKAIGKNAFYGCAGMDGSLVAPASLSVIGDNAFNGCLNLRGIDLSASAVTELEPNTFAGCINLAEVNLPSSLTAIPDNAFNGCGLVSIEIPGSVKSIGESAFKGCAHLSTITVPEGVESIGNSAFAQSGLMTVQLPLSLTELGEDAFRSSLLSYISFPSGLETLNANVAADCPNLLVVNLPIELKVAFKGSINSEWLTAINCPAKEPAATFDGSPFADVDNYTCALSIPKPSYTPYLQAEYWGSFIGIRNCIDISVGNGIDMTYMTEEDYREMLEEMGKNAPAKGRRAALKAMRESGFAGIDKGYGRLFDGASLYSEDGVDMRFFLDINPDVISWKVSYDGKDITDQVDPETRSFVIPTNNYSAALVVTTETVSVDELENGEIDLFSNGSAKVYSISGALLKVASSQSDLDILPAGVYIINGHKIALKR